MVEPLAPLTLQALQEARKREDIKAVLLRIDSPGGSGGCPGGG